MVNHPGLVNMLGAFQDAVCVYFVMEYVSGGEFFRQLRIREKYGLCFACTALLPHNGNYLQVIMFCTIAGLLSDDHQSGMPYGTCGADSCIRLQIGRGCC